MTTDLGGLLLLNLLFAAAGAGIAAACGWWRGPRGLVRSLGLSYLCGVAAFGVVAQLLYVCGASLARWQVLAVCLVPAAAILPALAGTNRPAAPPRSRWLLLAVPLGLFLALVAVDLWYQPLWRYDSWTIWTPKAHALWALGGLDARWFTGTDLISKDYPLLLPSVEAAGFRFTGYETGLLDLQSWLFLVGFLRAVYEIGARRARPELLWGVLAMVAVAPSVADQLAAAEADIPVAILFAAAGMCALDWLSERSPAALGLAAVLAAGAAATKVEGTIFTVALFASLACAAGWRAWRRGLLALAAGASALAAGIVPWRIWMHTHQVVSQADPGRVGGLTGLVHHASRVPAAAGYVLWRLLDPTAWLVLLPLAAFFAILVARRAHRVVVFLTGTTLLALAGLVLAYWSTPLGLHYQLSTSARRVVTGPVFFAAALTPLLVGRALPGARVAALRERTERALDHVSPVAAVVASAAFTVACEAATHSYARYGPEALVAGIALWICWRQHERLPRRLVLSLALLLPLGIALVHIARGVAGDLDIQAVYAPEGSALLQGRYPHAEYPPGGVLFFALEALIGHERDINPILLAPCNLALAWGIGSLRFRRSWFLAAFVGVWPLQAYFWEFKYDLLPTALLVLGLAAAARRNWVAAGALLGFGTAAKWTPGLAAVTLVLWLVLRRDVRAAIRLGAAALVSWAIVVVPCFVWSPGAVWASVTRQAPRGFTPESFWYLPFRAIGQALPAGPISLAAAAPHWANTVAVVAQLSLVLALAVFAATRTRPEAAIALSALVPALFLLLNKVFSAQYIVTIVAAWAVAAAVGSVSRRTTALLAWGIAIATAANVLVYPIGRSWQLGSVVFFASALGVTLVLLRAVGVRGVDPASRPGGTLAPL